MLKINVPRKQTNKSINTVREKPNQTFCNNTQKPTRRWTGKSRHRYAHNEPTRVRSQRAVCGPEKGSQMLLLMCDLAANGGWRMGFAAPWKSFKQNLVGSVVRDLASRCRGRQGARCLSGDLVAAIVWPRTRCYPEGSSVRRRTHIGDANDGAVDITTILRPGAIQMGHASAVGAAGPQSAIL